MAAAVAYIRVSSARQVEEGGSLDSQTRQIQQYAASRGYDLVRLFREEGESAKTDQRPQLQEMLRFCMDKSNGVQVVLIPKIDRLARNVHDYTNLKLQLSRLHIRLESLGEKIDDTPVGRFTETILASVAQFDNEIRAERSKGGMIDAVTQGRWVWQPPIGYRTIRHQGKGTIEPDPVFAPIIREAFRLLDEGHQGSRVVREYLRKHGVSRSTSTFFRLIHNPVYIGKIHAFGKVFDAKPPFLPLVDEATFYRAQRALKPSNLPQTYQVETDEFPLRGSIKCPCGRHYTASWAQGKLGKKYPYYRCAHCRGRSYKREAVHAFFGLELKKFVAKHGVWEHLLQRLMANEQAYLREQNAQQEAITTRIEELKSLRDAIALKNASGVIPDDLAKEQIQRLTEDIAHTYQALPETNPLEREAASLVAFARRFLDDLHSSWITLSLKTKKDLLRFLYPEGILFHPDSGFQTPENSLTERITQVFSGSKLHLVDQGSEFCKELHGWIRYLASIESNAD